MSLAPDEEFCSSCGEPMKTRAERCPNCGVNRNRPSDTDVGTGTTQFCTSCGEEILVEAELCPSCGVRQQSASTVRSGGAGDVLYYGQLALGGLLILGALGAVLEPEGSILSAIVSATVTAVLGLVLLPPVRSHFEKEYSLTKFGWKHTVDERSISKTSVQCTICQGEIVDGTRREYGKDFVVAGVTVYSDTGGVNTYCRSCSTGEKPGGSRTGERSVDETTVTDSNT